MTPEEIKALLSETLTEFKTGILAEVNRANSGTAAAVTKEIQKQLAAIATSSTKAAPEATQGEGGSAPTSSAPGTEQSGRLSLKELQAQIDNERKARESLQKQLEDERASSTRAKKQSAFATSVTNNKAANQGTLLKLLQYEYMDKLEFLSDGTPFIDGKPLDTFVKDFIYSEEGKPFRASSGVNGAGTSEGTTSPQGTDTKPKNKEEALNRIYQQGIN